MRAGLPLLGARPSSIYLLPSSSSFSFSIQCYGSFVSFSALLESRLHYRVFSVSPPHSHLQTHIETGKSIALIHYILDQERKKKYKNKNNRSPRLLPPILPNAGNTHPVLIIPPPTHATYSTHSTYSRSSYIDSSVLLQSLLAPLPTSLPVHIQFLSPFPTSRPVPLQSLFSLPPSPILQPADPLLPAVAVAPSATSASRPVLIPPPHQPPCSAPVPPASRPPTFSPPLGHPAPPPFPPHPVPNLPSRSPSSHPPPDWSRSPGHALNPLLPQDAAAQTAHATLSALITKLQGGPDEGSNLALPSGSPSGRSAAARVSSVPPRRNGCTSPPKIPGLVHVPGTWF